MSMMPSPENPADSNSPAPSRAEWRFAASLFGWEITDLRRVDVHGANDSNERHAQALVHTIANHLAREREAIHARYEAVAARCDREAASRRPFAEVDPEYRNTIIPYEAAADWIREVQR